MPESNGLPDNFDRLLGSLHGLPDITSTKSATVRAVTPILGTSQLYIVQTYRQREVGDTIFLECVGAGGTTRLAIPPSVSEVIARQRDALAAKGRARAAKQAAQTRKELGIMPGFMKHKKQAGGAK